MDPQSVAPEEGGGTLNDGTISEADELRKLADLKQQGFLTDEEFSTAKAKLLARMAPPSWRRPSCPSPTGHTSVLIGLSAVCPGDL